jgi:PEP-CTERM motif
MLRRPGFLSATICAALTFCAAATPAHAINIFEGSTLNFAGQSTCSSSGCTFGSALATSGSGAFNTFTFGTPATLFPAPLDPFTPGLVFSVTDAGGRIATFFANSRTSEIVTQTNGLTSYSFTDTGISTLTGFDDTPGVYLFTANQNGTIQGSFSSTLVSAAPEPGTWVMMIVGFGIVGASLRRRQKGTRRSPSGLGVTA